MPDNGIISEDLYMYEETCEHLTEGPVSDPQSEGCEECLKIGQTRHADFPEEDIVHPQPAPPS